MIITCQNFGGFQGSANLSAYNNAPTVITMPNGGGKTTYINAYIFALTGRCLTGFSPRNTKAGENDITRVIMSLGPYKINRILCSDGTKLKVNDTPMTQKEFEVVFEKLYSVSVAFAAACANVNLLTDPSLTSEQVRNLLVCVDVLEKEGFTELKRRQQQLRAKLLQVTPYALCNVVEELPTIPKMDQSSSLFLRRFDEAEKAMASVPSNRCPTCGELYSPTTILRVQNEINEAKKFVSANLSRARELRDYRERYEADQRRVEESKRMVAQATEARADLVKMNAELQTIEDELQRMATTMVTTNLPEGVTISTNKVSKNGKTSATCTLSYMGVPLKSVNRAKRVEICVRLLDNARAAHGLRNALPILVDNAESVQADFNNIPFIVLFKVGNN